MKHTINETKIARGARLGKIATFVGLGFLVGGLIVSLVFQESPLLWLSFLCLLLGLIVSSIGTANMNRWVREPRADQALGRALKGFDDRYRLYSYCLPAPHVLLSPLGLFVLTALGQDGAIRFDGKKFRRDFSLARLLRFMAEEGLGNPLSEADAQVEALRKFLAAHDLEDVEIKNLLVFFSPQAQLEITDPPRPIVTPKGLKKALRKQGGKLPGGLYQRLERLFDAEADL